MAEDHAKLEALIAKCFALRDRAHRRHWATGSYSEHVTLGDLYGDLPDKLDAFIEAYQGCYGRAVKEPSVSNEVMELLEWVEENGDLLSLKTTHLQNLLDAISEELSTSYFKLNNLE